MDLLKFQLNVAADRENQIVVIQAANLAQHARGERDFVPLFQCRHHGSVLFLPLSLRPNGGEIHEQQDAHHHQWQEQAAPLAEAGRQLGRMLAGST